jgi:hypothetical protein
MSRSLVIGCKTWYLLPRAYLRPGIVEHQALRRLSSLPKHALATKTSEEPSSIPTPRPRSMRTPGFWTSRRAWKRAGINTLRCLVGCTVGDFSMLWYLQINFHTLDMGTTMGLSSKPSTTISRSLCEQFSDIR